MTGLLHDVRYAWRGLRRAPGFAAAALATLGVGIGATAAIFAVVRAVLLAPLPYSEPDRRLMIWSRWSAFPKTWVADAEIYDYRRMCPALESVAAWYSGEANVTSGGEPERLGMAAVTANVFETLGARPLLGRAFTPDEDRPGGPPVAVIGYAVWQRRFAGDPGVLGRVLEVDGVATRIVGVMPRGFVLPTDFTVDAASPSQFWIPVRIDAGQLTRNHGLYAAAALVPGASATRASAELHAAAASLTRQGFYPPEDHFDALGIPLETEIRGGARRILLLVLGAVGFLLLMACANVANLLLARAEGRRREISIRIAVGAGQSRLLRQLVTESVVLAAGGVVVGLAVAGVGIRLIAAHGAAGLPALAPIGAPIPLLLAGAALGLATALLFGLAPAFQALRPSLAEDLRESGSATAAAGRQRFRFVLAGAQMALAVLLLLGAGLLLRSLEALRRIDLGFQPDGVLTASLSPPESAYPRPESVVAFYRAVLEQVRALPGVRAAGLVRSLPLGSEIGDWGLDVEGFADGPGRRAKGDWQVVSDGALEALRERLVRGRPLMASDTAGALPVCLVNETLARTYFAGRDPIGGRLRMGSDRDRPWMTVVGVVRDERHNGLTAAIKEKFYVPYAQFPAARGGGAARNMTIVVRAGGNPVALAAPVAAAVRRVDPAMPLANVRTLRDVVDRNLAGPRWAGWLLSGFGAIALALAGVGVGGVLSYLVSRRRREIGIRMALGASRGNVLGLVLRPGLATAAAGIAAGLGAAVFLTRFLETLLYGVTAHDPTTFAAVAALLLLLALVATALPALEATRVDPLESLRTD